MLGARVLRQFNDDGTEVPSTVIRPEEVVRVSLLPRVGGLQRHDLLIDRSCGEQFVRRFGRGFLKNSGEGFKSAEYLQVVETTHYRMWVFSTSGRALVTNPKFELYL